MAFQGSGLLSNPNSNYFSFTARKPNEGKIPNTSEMITGSSHTYIIDSRERNLIAFPNPASYTINFNDKFKNVTSIELKGSLIPKTEYNVNTGNMYIPYNIDDSLKSAKIVKPGYGYLDGTYGFGGVGDDQLLATVSTPAIAGGTQATITVVVTNNLIKSVVINAAGTGYLAGSYGGLEDPSKGYYRNARASAILNIPVDPDYRNTFQRGQIDLTVGTILLATLIPGQYDFASPNDGSPGLCREVTRALQESIDDAISNGTVVPVVGGPQTGAEYFPYLDTNPDDGSCYLITVNPNASPNSNIAIQRGAGDGSFVQSPFLEFVWSYEDTSDSSAIRLLGYGSSIVSQKFKSIIQNPPVDQTNNTLSSTTWIESPIIGRNDYDLTDSPMYCILSFSDHSQSGDRIESTNPTLDKAFATLVFDANSSNVIFREPEATVPDPGTGPSNWGTLLNKPGMLKAIKGQDFDPKVLSFGPSPISELNGLTLCFRKLNGDLIDFHGKDHMLIFSINAEDINSGNKW